MSHYIHCLSCKTISCSDVQQNRATAGVCPGFALSNSTSDVASGRRTAGRSVAGLTDGQAATRHTGVVTKMAKTTFEGEVFSHRLLWTAAKAMRARATAEKLGAQYFDMAAMLFARL